MKDEGSSWLPLDLTSYLTGEYRGPQPTLFTRTDGRSLLYPGKIHSIAGPPGSGKSWLGQAASAEQLMRGSNVLFFDFEDSPDSVVSREKMLGVDDVHIASHFGYVSPSEPMPKNITDLLRDWLDAVDLVVIDGVTDAMHLHGLDPLRNDEAAAFMRDVVSPLRDGTRQPAELLIDHVPKNPRNRNAPVGAQHKLAAVHVQYLLDAGVPFDQDNAGSGTLFVVKDRYGQVQRFAERRKGKRVAADVRFQPSADGLSQMAVRLDPPGPITQSADVDDLTLEAITAAPGMTKTEIKKRVPKRDHDVAAAIEGLVASGKVDRTGREGQRADVYAVVGERSPSAPSSL